MNTERRAINLGPAAFNVVTSVLVPPGRYQVNVDDHEIAVNPAYLETFLNTLRKEFEDDRGERAFAI